MKPRAALQLLLYATLAVMVQGRPWEHGAQLGLQLPAWDPPANLEGLSPIELLHKIEEACRDIFMKDPAFAEGGPTLLPAAASRIRRCQLAACTSGCPTQGPCLQAPLSAAACCHGTR